MRGKKTYIDRNQPVKDFVDPGLKRVPCVKFLHSSSFNIMYFDFMHSNSNFNLFLH